MESSLIIHSFTHSFIHSLICFLSFLLFKPPFFFSLCTGQVHAHAPSAPQDHQQATESCRAICRFYAPERRRRPRRPARPRMKIYSKEKNLTTRRETECKVFGGLFDQQIPRINETVCQREIEKLDDLFSKELRVMLDSLRSVVPFFIWSLSNSKSKKSKKGVRNRNNSSCCFFIVRLSI